MAVFVHPPRYSNSMQKRKGGYEFSFPTFLDFLGDWFLTAGTNDINSNNNCYTAKSETQFTG